MEGLENRPLFIARAEAAFAVFRSRLSLAEKRAEHTEQWYAERVARLTDLAKEHGIWPEVACILANGTADSTEPPTYAQQLNVALARAESLATEIAHVREFLEGVDGRTPGDDQAIDLVLRKLSALTPKDSE